MNSLIPMLSPLLFLAITLLGSKHLYYLYVKNFTENYLDQFQYNLSDLKYSFDQINYIVTLPSTNPLLFNASLGDLFVEKEYLSSITPSVQGMKIILRGNNEEQLIAYISKDTFRFPILDRLVSENKIDEDTYSKISAYKFLHPATTEEILKEVHKQLHSQKYISI